MSVGPMDNNTYLVTCSRTGETLLIDAANDPELLMKLVGEHAPKLALIVTTHQHFDHWQALEAVAGATGAPTAAHQLDAEPLPVAPDRFLAGGDTVSVGDLTFDVIHLRGTPPARWPSRCGRPRNARHPLVHRRLSVPGRPWADNNSGGVRLPMTGLETHVFDVYGDDTVIYPGHGDDTIIGEERP